MLVHFGVNVALKKHAAYMFMKKSLETNKANSMVIMKFNFCWGGSWT